MKKYEICWLIFMSVISITVGWVYALHQTDVHHWGFIAGTALDHMRGREFYSDMYVQYGVGQPILFKFLSHFLPVNYTSLGIFTDFIYSFNLMALYFIVRKLTNPYWAIVVTAGALCMHSFPIYPWPDYYAGLFLSLACYQLIQTKERTSGNQGLAGVLLFVTFIFRNTYLINLSAAFFTYLVLSLIFHHLRSKKIYHSMGIFFGLVMSYFGFLYLQGNLHAWFMQTLETGQSQYGVFSSEPILRLLRHIFYFYKPYLPANLVTTTWSLLFYLGFFCIGLSVLKPTHRVLKESKVEPATLLLFSLIGLAGIAQNMVVWEGFRLQNACSPLYLVFAIFIYSYFPDLKNSLKSRKFQISFLVYLVILAARFPHGSTLWPIYDGSLDSYQESKIPYFKFHRFKVEDEIYYTEMRKYLCDGRRKIINLTADSTLPFLCDGQKNGLVLPFYIEGFQAKLDPKMVQEVKMGDYSEDEVVVSDIPMGEHANETLIEIAILNRPASTRWYGAAPVKIYYSKTTKN